MAKMTGSKGRKKSNLVTAKTASPGVETEYTSEKFLTGFEGMTTKEIKRVIDLVDQDVKFEDACKQVKEERK
ncbi:MAG: hypothetical protein PHN69_07270 [Candidatus Pacebacteria bacterium]|nr:hypothetical protein [Candidatus Paceibacterota bacterium]